MDSEVAIAETELNRGLDQLLCGQDTSLAAVIHHVIDPIEQAVNCNVKCLRKVVDKITRKVNREHVKSSDHLSGVHAKIVSMIYNILGEIEMNLTMISYKGSIIGPNETINVTTINRVHVSCGEKEGMRIVLSLREIRPLFDGLLEVLREIRDRLEGAPVEYKSEPPAKFESDEGAIDWTQSPDLNSQQLAFGETKPQGDERVS